MAKADNPEKIMDVKAPDSVKPSATTRPLLVTNRPVGGTDPMVIADVVSKKTTEPEEAAETNADQAPSRNNKIITPLTTATTEELQAQTDHAKVSEDAPATDAEASSDAKAQTHEATHASGLTSTEGAASSDQINRDSEAALAEAEVAADDAKAIREAELEELIASGKYVVPINAKHHRRSARYVVILVVATLLLALLIFDAMLDIGVVHAPPQVPHTNFSGNNQVGTPA